jgi:hypothetical protein
MRLAIALAAVLAASTSMMGGVVSIVSPDHPQTFTYGEMIWHELYLGCRPGGLAARITFSNLPYAGDDEPRSDEPFDFRFPGVRFDAGRQTFFANGRHGKLIEVARFHSDPSFGWIDLAPGTKIYLIKQSGRVTAILTATDYPRSGMRWIEINDNFSLQNLLVSLFRELHIRLDSGSL